MATPATLDGVLTGLSAWLRHEAEDGAGAIEWPAPAAAARTTTRRPAVATATPVQTATPSAAAKPIPAAAPTPPPTAPPPAAADGDSLERIAAEIAACKRCPLHTGRSRTVPGAGHPRAELMFVGEGPGTEEDRQGLPFVGPAGAILTRMIVRMGFTREEVFIANIVKCRPTEKTEHGLKDRPPSLEEMAGCIPYLQRQIALIQPRVLVALGNTALEGLVGMRGITKLRGQWQTYRGIPLMPTYHPSFLLRNGGDAAGGNKKFYWDVWQDLEQVLARLGRQAPPR